MAKKVIILGAAGRMGQSLIKCILEKKVSDLEIIGAVDLWDAENLNNDIGVTLGLNEAGVLLSSDLNALGEESDVIIDFSSHVCTSGNAERIKKWNTSWVIGTTGLNEEQLSLVKDVSESIPVLISGNMSLGINILSKISEQVAKILKDKNYDIEIIEKHHNNKIDAPSGTALMLGKSVADGYNIALEDAKIEGRGGLVGKRKPHEIGFHSIRGGDIIGEHNIIFAGSSETIEISHTATDRSLFAMGALEAAQWLVDQKPGLYSMSDVLSL